MGITSVKHVCKARVPIFDPGDQVLVEVHMFDEYDGGGYGMTKSVFGKFRGVFIQQKSTKGICFIKPGTVCEEGGTTDDSKFTPRNDGNGYVKVLLLRIEKIEGAERLNMEECKFCGGHTHITGVCGQGSDDYYRPASCPFKEKLST